MSKKKQPRVSTALAVSEPDAVLSPKAGDEYAERVAMLHTAAEQHASASVLCAAMAGAVMIQKKKACKHGEFTEWLEGIELPNGKTVKIRTCQNYMKLAGEMAERLKGLPKAQRVAFLGDGTPESKTAKGLSSTQSIVSLLASIDPTQADDLRRQAIAEAVREVTNEESLRQLYFDWGIMKDPQRKRTGGDVSLQHWLKEHHPDLAGTKLAGLPAEVKAEYEAYVADRKPTDAEILEAKREDAKMYWMRQRTYLREFGCRDVPTWGLLPDKDLLETMVTLEQIAKQMKRVLNERGAR